MSIAVSRMWERFPWNFSMTYVGNYTKVGTNRLRCFLEKPCKGLGINNAINQHHSWRFSIKTFTSWWFILNSMATHALMIDIYGLCIWLTRISQDSETTLAYEILLLIHKGAGEIIEGLPTETPATKPDTFFIPKKSFRWISQCRLRIFPTLLFCEEKWCNAYLINTTPLQPSLHDIPTNLITDFHTQRCVNLCKESSTNTC